MSLGMVGLVVGVVCAILGMLHEHRGRASIGSSIAESSLGAALREDGVERHVYLRASADAFLVIVAGMLALGAVSVFTHVPALTPGPLLGVLGALYGFCVARRSRRHD